MNKRGGEDYSGSAVYANHLSSEQGTDSNFPASTSIAEPSNPRQAGYYPYSPAQESVTVTEQSEGMTRDYASQPQRTLPGIRDVLGDRHPYWDDAASNWNSSVHDAPRAHSRSSSQSYSSENNRVMEKSRFVVNSRGAEIHPPMKLDPSWTYLDLSVPEYDYSQPGANSQPQDNTSSGAQRAGNSADNRPSKAYWGHTKSGNPRKRQSEACENCRQKKIKCDPKANDGGGRVCVHCDKLGVDCQWRNQSVVFSNPASDPDNNHPGYNAPLKTQVSMSSHGSPQSPSPKMSPSSKSRRSVQAFNWTTNDEDTKMPLSKKPRLGRQTSDEAELAASHADTSHKKVVFKTVEADSDPFETDKSVALELLKNYFTYHDHSTDKILPRSSFTAWCKEETRKTPIDLILVYATLAIGSVFGTTKALKDQGRLWAQLARVNVDRANRNNLKLALAKLHLAAFFWAEGQANLAYDYSGRGMIALLGLRYDTEAGCLDGVSSAAEENDFGFTSAELVECRRRVFWHGYTTSSIKCFETSGYRPADADVLVRVPNLEHDYESGIQSEGPYFCAGDFDPTKCGLTATKVYIASIWGELNAQHRRSTQCGPEQYLQGNERFYTEMRRRLNLWFKALPEKFQYSPENTRKSIRDDYFVEYYVLNACYHIAMMKLHRYGRVDYLPNNTVVNNIIEARKYARQFLELISIIARSDETIGCQSKRTLEAASYQPFALEAIMFACDVLSSRGHLRGLSELQSFLGHAISVFSESARVFSSANRQKSGVETRLAELGAHVAMKDSRRPHWNFEKTIDQTRPAREKLEQSVLPRNMDLIYGTKEELFFEALNNHTAVEHVPLGRPKEESRTPPEVSRSF